VTPEDLRAYLTQRGAKFEERTIPYATQFRCATGEIFNVYDSGKLTFGGKPKSALAQAVRQMDSDPDGEVSDQIDPGAKSQGAVDDRVFVVYGHDKGATDGLELLLHKDGHEADRPREPTGRWGHDHREAGEVSREGWKHWLRLRTSHPGRRGLLRRRVRDQEVSSETERSSRARMVLSRLGRSRVAILYKQSVELPSDINGLLYLPFKERVEETKGQLFQELENAGYRPQSAGLRLDCNHIVPGAKERHDNHLVPMATGPGWSTRAGTSGAPPGGSGSAGSAF
jgi:predicted nucleotide-binding protein